MLKNVILIILLLCFYNLSYADETKVWTNPTILQGGVTYSQYCGSGGSHSLTMNNTNKALYGVWVGGTTDKHIYYATDDTGDWEINPAITDRDCNNTSIAVSDVSGSDDIHIVWESTINDTTHIQYTSMEYMWSAYNITNDYFWGVYPLYSNHRPSILIDNEGYKHITWYGGEADTNTRIFYANNIFPTEKVKADTFFIHTITIEDDSKNPTFCMDDSNNIYLTWQGGGETPQIYFASSIDTFQSIIQVTNNTYDNTNPSIAIDPENNLYIAYESNTGVYSQISYAYTDSNEIWQTDDVTSESFDNYNPSIAIGVFGGVHIVWEGEYSTGIWQIYYSSNFKGVFEPSERLTENIVYSYHTPNFTIDASAYGHIFYRGEDGTGNEHIHYLMSPNPLDDDISEPIFSSFNPENVIEDNDFLIRCMIEDASGIYDDTTGVEGQGVYLLWDTEALDDSSNILLMSETVTGWFWTDSIISPSSSSEADTIMYRIYAYDNDTDFGNIMDRTQGISGIQFITIQDDTIGPIFDNFLPDTVSGMQSFNISCCVYDPSGVYDDITGSAGQGMYLLWDEDGTIDASSNEVTMSRVGSADTSDIFQTDTEITLTAEPNAIGDFVYQVFAYDNDADGGDINDRTQDNSEVIYISGEPPELMFGVLQNPVLQKYFDIYIISNEKLASANIRVTENGSASTNLEVSTLDTINFVYAGDYTADSESALLSIAVSITDLAGWTTKDTIDFTGKFFTVASSGYISSPDKELRVYLPEGALSKETYAIILPLKNDANYSLMYRTVPYNTLAESISKPYLIGPENQLLDKDATITFYYDNINNKSEEHLSIAYYNHNNWELLPSQINIEENQIKSQINKFGIYQLQWNADYTIEESLPNNYKLKQNYPNPFNPKTTITYQLPNSADVSLKIYNINGQLVRTLVKDNLESGTYSILWDGNDDSGKTLASGIYLYKLEANDYSESHKMILLK